MDTQISKNITKTIEPLDNADESYNIEVKCNYCITSSFNSVYYEIKNLFTILLNEKEKFYFNTTPLISEFNPVTNKYRICKLKSGYFLCPTDSCGFVEIISILSYNFHNLINPEIFSIHINICYDFIK